MYLLTKSLKKSMPHAPNVGTLCEVTGQTDTRVDMAARLATGDRLFSVSRAVFETHFEQVEESSMTEQIPDFTFEALVHPFANEYPRMSASQFAELKADIERNGLREPVVYFEHKILDGRHRAEAFHQLRKEGAQPRATSITKVYNGITFEGTEEEARAFVDSLNLYRRQLRAEQEEAKRKSASDRRAAIATAIITAPQVSDRQIAVQVGASPSTVGTVRKELEQKGDVSKLDTRVDTQGREQPATKPPKIETISVGEKALQSFFDEEGAVQIPDEPQEGAGDVETVSAIEEPERESSSAGDWRVYAGERLREAETVIYSVIANTPTGAHFDTEDFLRAVESARAATRAAIRLLAILPAPTVMTEAEAVAFEQEDEEELEIEICAECECEIAPDLLGSEIAQSRGDIAVLESGVVVLSPDSVDECFLCVVCAQKRWDSAFGRGLSSEAALKEQEPTPAPFADIEDRGEGALFGMASAGTPSNAKNAMWE